MSAPQTNLEKQKRRHRGPLIGIALGLVFIVGLAVFWAAAGSDTADPGADAVPAADPSGTGTGNGTGIGTQAPANP